MYLRSIYIGTEINENQESAARKLGLCIHREPVVVDGEYYGDHVFAADPGWVDDYRRNGGLWAYVD